MLMKTKNIQLRRLLTNFISYIDSTQLIGLSYPWEIVFSNFYDAIISNVSIYDSFRKGIFLTEECIYEDEYKPKDFLEYVSESSFQGGIQLWVVSTSPSRSWRNQWPHPGTLPRYPEQEEQGFFSCCSCEGYHSALTEWTFGERGGPFESQLPQRWEEASSSRWVA